MSSDYLIFGGAFNPVHKGHLHIIHNVLSCYPQHKMLIVPSSIPPFKADDPHLLSFEHRFKLLEIALEDYAELYSPQEADRLILSDIEHRHTGVMYTSLLVKKLKDDMACDRVCFVVGDDVLQDLGKWHDIEYLKENVEFVVYHRTPMALENVSHRKKDGFRIKYLEGSVLDVSSSQIRSGEKTELLTPRCAAYIAQNRLYEKFS